MEANLLDDGVADTIRSSGVQSGLAECDQAVPVDGQTRAERVTEVVLRSMVRDGRCV